MKCRAPYGSSWGGIGYHNAMVWSVHREENESITSLNDIKASDSTTTIFKLLLFNLSFNST